MISLNLGEREIAHPIAYPFAHGSHLLEQVHLSQSASTSIPRSRKERGPLENPLVGPPPVKPDRAAQYGYTGTRKPSLVLAFKPSGERRFMHWISAYRYVEVVRVRNLWCASLRASQVCAIEGVEGVLSRRWGTLLRGDKATTPLAALFALARLPRWYWHAGQWRSLAYLYKSLIFTGLGTTPSLPKTRQTRLICAHASGHWCWDRIVVRPLPAPRLPNNAGLSRTPSMPDLRSEMAYVPDDPGHLPRTRVGDTWVVKAPTPRPYSQKDPSPRSFVREAPTGVPMRAWMNAE